ncbi:hypothetical protein WH47_00757 [Habropoda laboriosa]|uniref:Uncharacterized protein n=2 Tax=Habropoda laboriosa TaxID=597456 RepID=A0A0L7QYK6_9HYME|nr:hypothetical protein WH47_00757 [Habropoda laboriosa]
MLLNEGRRYLITLEKFRKKAKDHLSEYKKILHAIDRYTRYKAQLMEDMEVLKEILNDTDNDVEDDEGTVESDEAEYMQIELEEFVNEEEEDFVFEEQFCHSHNIVHRKNILANMELLISQMFKMDINVVNFQRAMYTKFMNVLKEYCVTVQMFLNSNAVFAESQNVNLEKKQLIKNIETKYKELQQLFVKVTEV